MKRSDFSLPLVILLSLPFIGIGVYLWTNWEGYRNLGTCKSLKPGIMAPDLTAALGQSIGRSGSWWYFKTPSIDSGPIRAFVSEPSGKVLELRCYEDGPTTWTLPEQENK